MEVENIGIPVILQGLDLNGDQPRRNSFSVIPREVEPDCDEPRRNSISVIPGEVEHDGGDVRRNSIAVIAEEIDPSGSVTRRNSIPEIPQERDPKGGDVRGNSVRVIPEEIEPIDGNIRRSYVGKVDPPSNIKTNSVPVIPQEVEPKDDDTRRNSIAVVTQEREPNNQDIKQKSIPEIPQEMEPKGGDIRKNYILAIPQEAESDGGDIRKASIGKVETPDMKRNSIPVISQEMEPNGGDVRRHSMAVILQEIVPKDNGVRRNSTPGIQLEMEPKGGDTRKNYVIVIPCDDIRRKSGVKIQSRYLRAPLGSCHDYCKYGARNASEEEAATAMAKSHRATGSAGQNLEATTSAESKKMFTTSPKTSPDSDTQNLDNSVVTDKKVISTIARKSCPESGTRKLNSSVVTEKKVLSLTKKETAYSKKVSSPKEIDVCTEELVDSKLKAEKLEPSCLPGSFRDPNNLKVMSTMSPKPSPDFETQKFVVTEKRVSFPFKDIDASTEDSIDSKFKAEKLEPSSLPGSVLSLRNSKVIYTISPKPSPDTETQKLDRSVVTEKRVLSLKKKETVSSRKVSTNKKETDVSAEGSVSQVKPEQLEPPSLPGQGSSNQEKSGTIKSKEITEGSSSGGNRKIRSKNPRTSVLVEKKMLGPETVSLTSKHPVKRVPNVNTGSSENLKGSSHLKDQNNPGEVEPDELCSKDIPEKILYVIESNTENSTVEPTRNGVNATKLSSISPLKDKSLKQVRKGIGTTQSPPPSGKKNLKRTVNGGYARSPAALCPENKGLRCSTRTSLSSSSSTSSSMSISSSASTHKKESGTTSRRNTTKTDNQIANLKVESKTRPQRSGILSCEIKNSVARKLTFRRGRVLDLKPDNSTPRRLKFRRVRLVREIQNGEESIKRGSIGRKEVDDSQAIGSGIRRGSVGRNEVDDGQSNGAGIKRGSIGRKEVGDSQSNGAGIKRGSSGRKEFDDSQSHGTKIKCEKVVLKNKERDVDGSPRKSLRRKEVSAGVSNGANTSSEKVVLRHQDVKGTKDVQKLFNNVIEETASRLVGTRKSKVKALVGAFETVISLQDTRPSAVADAF